MAVAMTAVLFTGCGKNYEKVVTVDGVDFAPNMYLCAQYNAYNNAWSMVEDDVEDIMSATIEEMSAADWIHAETIKDLQVYAWTEKTFEEMGLSLAQEELDYIDQLVEYYWPYMEETYAANGIGKETYKKFNTFSYKYDKIFSALYEDGGEMAPTTEEYKAYMDDNYARITGFYMPKLDKEGEVLPTKDIEKIKAYCEEAVAELNSGASLEETSVKYKTLAGDYLAYDIDYSDASNNIIDSYIGKESTAFSAEVEEKAFSLSPDSEYVYGEMDEDLIVYKRIENFSTEAELDNVKSSLLSEMKSEEFNAYAEEQASQLAVEEVAAAVKYYAVKKIK